MARLRKKPVAVEVRTPALFVECEWLVAAIDAGLVERILLVSDTTARTLAGGELALVDPTGLRPAPRAEPVGSPPRDSLTLIDTGAGWVPAWDLDALLGSEPGRGSAWIVVRAPASWPIAAFALRTGRCVCVRAMPRSTDLPPGLVDLGDAALRAAFATSTIPELAGYSTGVVLDPRRVLRAEQLARAAAELERA